MWWNIWEYISCVEMESSKIINYSTNTCQSGRGTYHDKTNRWEHNCKCEEANGERNGLCFERGHGQEPITT